MTSVLAEPSLQKVIVRRAQWRPFMVPPQEAVGDRVRRV